MRFRTAQRKKMVAIAAALVACMMMAGCGASANTVDISSMEFNPQGKTIKQIAAALESGETTSRQLVSYYLDRINKYDDNGPEINAITQINPHVMRQAHLSDRGRKDHAQHSIFYGIPFVVKENIDVEGMNTTAGSKVLETNKARSNATVVQKLIDQGAIVLAKTNMSELAASYGWLGYSSYGGQTKNPYNLKRDPSGSSSGTAAAVAAGFAPFGLGSDTSGSVRGPASVTGTVGVVSLTGRQAGQG